ncbi:MAG: SRPBCC family protein [Planctomycetota bacterium]
MKPITVSIDIAAPAERVWDRISDIENAARTIPAIRSIEILSETRRGLGTRWRETRVMFGREATETMEITGWRPPHEYVASAASHGSEYRSALRVTPAGAGCRLEFEFSARPVSFAAKVLSFVLAPVMRGAVVKALRADLGAIRAACEAAG